MVEVEIAEVHDTELHDEIQAALDGKGEAPKIVDTKKEVPPKKERKHITKDEWVAKGKDPEKWKSPEQFDHDGSFFEKIESQTKYIKSLETKLKKLEERSHQEDKSRYEQTREYYLSERDKAVLTGRLDKYNEIQRNIEQLQAPEEPQYERRTDHYSSDEERDLDQSFINRNKGWWNYNSIENMKMVGEASQLAKELSPYLRTGEIDAHRLISLVEEEMSRRYPHKFGTDEEDDEVDETQEAIEAVKDEIKSLKEEVSKPKAPIVESRGIPKSKFTEKDLPKELRELYLEAKRKGFTSGMSPKEYYDEFKKYER